jgi:hypothetical protein
MNARALEQLAVAENYMHYAAFRYRYFDVQGARAALAKAMDAVLDAQALDEQLSVENPA